jgi:hypothetical protein
LQSWLAQKSFRSGVTISASHSHFDEKTEHASEAKRGDRAQ